MANWRVQKVSPSTYYNVAELLECKRQRNGINTAKVSLPQGSGLVDDTEVKLLDASDTVVLHGYIKKGDTSTVGLDVYEISEVAILLGDYLVQDPAWSNTYNLSYVSQTVNDVVDKIVASAPGWSRGSTNVTTIDAISFYFTTCLSALYKTLKDTKKINVWFDSATKTIYFGDYRTNQGVLTYIYKETTSHSKKRKVNKVVVVGSSADVFGYGWDMVSNPKTVAFQFNDVKSAAEADMMAMEILDRYGSSYSNIKVYLSPRVDIWDSDKVTVNAVDYIVDEVDIRWEETVLSLIPYGVADASESMSTVIDDMNKEVKLDATGSGIADTRYLRKDAGAGNQTENNQVLMANNLAMYNEYQLKFYQDAGSNLDGKIFGEVDVESSRHFIITAANVDSYLGLTATDPAIVMSPTSGYVEVRGSTISLSCGATTMLVWSPLRMESYALDMDTHQINNLAAPSLVTDAARYKDGFVICTSTTRPASPTEGMHIYETDTDKDYKCTVGGATPTWVEIGAGGGAVSSVFGRTGDVVAATNDYTWAQINKATSSISDITTKDHHLLNGLSDNDHPQYALLTADNIFTGDHQIIRGSGGSVANYPSIQLRNTTFGATDYNCLFLDDSGYVNIGEDGVSVKLFGGVNSVGNIRPNASATYDLGTTTYKWNYLYAVYLSNNGSDITFKDDISMLKATSTYGDLKNAGNITPGVTDAKTLGTSSLFWSAMYGQALYVDDANTKVDNNTGNMRFTVASGKKFEFVVV